MKTDRIALGKKGEALAVQFLKKKGYRVVEKNYRVRQGELDIIARDKKDLVFVEVKSRSGCGYGTPAEAVTFHKQRQISKVALLYLSSKNLHDEPARFDVVTVLFDRDPPKIELFQNAFDFCA